MLCFLLEFNRAGFLPGGEVGGQSFLLMVFRSDLFARRTLSMIMHVHVLICSVQGWLTCGMGATSGTGSFGVGHVADPGGDRHRSGR